MQSVFGVDEVSKDNGRQWFVFRLRLIGNECVNDFKAHILNHKNYYNPSVDWLM